MGSCHSNLSVVGEDPGEETDSTVDFVALLAEAGSQLGSQLQEAWSTPLRQYLARLIPPPAKVNRHFQHVLDALGTTLSMTGKASPDVWQAALVQWPVIQQADHSFLLLDTETLLNNVLFSLALRQKGADRGITVQCSSVSCVARREPLRGSPFLRRAGHLYNVLGESRRTYAKSAFCTLPQGISTPFLPQSAGAPGLAGDPFLGHFIGRRWNHALEAFQIINESIAHQMSQSLSSRLLVVDDRWSGELLARHLEDSESPLFRLIFDGQIRHSFLRHKRAAVQSPANISVNRIEPDFFWFREGRRLRPVLWPEEETGPVFSREPGCQALPFPITPDALAERLRACDLIPDKILIFLARCLLPGIQAIGGPSQQDYVGLYQKMLLGCHAETGLLTHEELETAGRPTPSWLGGAPLIEMDARETAVAESIQPDTDFVAWLSPYLDRPVGKTIGTLSGARYLEARARKAIQFRINEHPGN